MKAIALTQQVSARRRLLVRALAGVLGALAALAALPQKAHAGVFIGVGVSVSVPPPPLPIYEQPPIPGAGYIWTPGYWAWDGDEYYWVPGTWVIAPFYGALWTPAYWGWDGGVYVFHHGYWGDHVGFYGGINYGCGYTGVGYAGGYWGHHGFYYNRSVNRIDNVHITNVYNKTVIHNFNANRVSYNGGRGGVVAHATPQQLAFARHSRMGPVAAQQQQMNVASHDPAMRLSSNHGNPPVAATQRPGAFGAGATAARAAGSFAPTAANAQRMNNAVVHAPQTMQPNNSMALRSANFAPHANAGANMPRMNSAMTNTPRSYQPNHGTALHSANFAPHANAPAAANMARPAGSYSNLYRPGGVTGVGPSRPMQPVSAPRPMNTYRAPSTAYRPAPAAAPAYHPQPQFRAPQYQYHAPAAPQYRAARPAPAPHSSGGGAPHGGGGGHDMRHG